MSDEDVAATQRLEKLVTGLDDVDLRLDLGSGWSVTTALGHLAFWDREQRLNLAAGHAPGRRRRLGQRDVDADPQRARTACGDQVGAGGGARA